MKALRGTGVGILVVLPPEIPVLEPPPPAPVDTLREPDPEELALSEHAHTRIDSLSGGQRKRASVAVELLGSPGLLLLDEPTTGMDPGLESKMMRLFRELADRSRGVALVTHATKNLALCDRVVTMGRGGVLTFCGSPVDACSFFGVEDFDGIYGALDETPASEWRARFGGSASVMAHCG